MHPGKARRRRGFLHGNLSRFRTRRRQRSRHDGQYSGLYAVHWDVRGSVVTPTIRGRPTRTARAVPSIQLRVRPPVVRGTCETRTGRRGLRDRTDTGTHRHARPRHTGRTSPGHAQRDCYQPPGRAHNMSGTYLARRAPRLRCHARRLGLEKVLQSVVRPNLGTAPILESF